MKTCPLIPALLSLILLSSAVNGGELKLPGHGGLIVHVICGDGTFLATLHSADRGVFHGLTRDAAELAAARANLHRRQIYGPVSVDLWTEDSLPYIDNSVNLLIVDDPGAVSRDEILRVLVPLGTAWLRERPNRDVSGTAEAAVTRIVKPWPDNIDEWTHYLHDAGNNAVAHDTAIGPLRHLQWDAAPRYSRHHEFTSSVAAMVSARGRLFSIIDMGSRASIHMPAKWKLTARDAFNGIVLWERDIDSWFNHLWPLKNGPAQPPRRLVAVGDSVYVTLGLEAPVSQLDAATGTLRRTYPGTAFTEEMLHANGTLFLLKHSESMNPKDYYPKLMVCWDEKKRTLQESEGLLLKPDEKRTLMAFDTQTGTRLWQQDHAIEPLTLAADDDHVYFHNWTGVVCLDRRTGSERWQSRPVAPRKSMGYVYGPTLVSYGDVVLFADGRQQRKIFALSKKDGQLLWQAPHYPAGHAGSPEDLLVVDGLVWCGKIAGGSDDGVFTGRDPLTGETKREFTPNVDTYWFHHRCYRAKATDEYILASRTGIEFVDVREQSWETHHWVRGACTYGILPCNGLVYAPPHPCACYLESKLNGLCALAPARRPLKPLPAASRLVQGPAYGEAWPPEQDDSAIWPTYRHDVTRSGATPAPVSLPLGESWRAAIGGTLTAPVIADGRVYVAAPETHRIHALNARNGSPLWTFTAGARVDSPPAIYRGRVLFGSADGCIYCLRARDGELVWRFTAAPENRRLVSYGRLESVWPVHGNLLVDQGTVTCIAGRSTHMDGGLRFYRLDAVTGRVLLEKQLYDQQSPQQDVKVLNMPTALTDILSSDGHRIYMRSQVFDREGNRVQTVDPLCEPFERATQQLGEGVHLFSATGFLDDDAWHRSYWIYGRALSYGCNWWFRAGRYAPAGRMLVFDDESVYGFGREPALFVWSHVLENHLFRSARQADAEAIDHVKQWSKTSDRDAVFNRRFMRGSDLKDHHAPDLHWSVKQPPLHARAMVLAGDKLVAAGPPDVLDEDDAFNHPFQPETQARILAQDAAYAGRNGARLLVVSAANGATLAERDLPALPVWDGMAAAQGRLFISLADGSVLCLGEGPVALKVGR
jgi:outer membrane protein assembly factor BamB